ncbi:abortive infection bacterioresistance protein [Salmonella phage 21]|nr:abortive infection bacterioresistance protein [Salmonella phage 21]
MPDGSQHTINCDNDILPDVGLLLIELVELSKGLNRSDRYRGTDGHSGRSKVCGSRTSDQ